MRRVMAALFGCWSALAQAQGPLPTAEGWVLDQAEVLSPRIESQLEVELTEFNYSTGSFIAVLLVPASAETADLSAYGQQVLQSWGLATPGSRGAVLLWSSDGYVALQVTPDATAQLNSGLQSEIMLELMAPAFADGDPDRGVETSVRRMMAVLDGSAPSPTASSQPAEPASMSDEAQEDAPYFPGEVAEPESNDDLPANLGADAERIVRGLSEYPGDTLDEILAAAGRQLDQLPDFVNQAIKELQGEGENSDPALGSTRLGLSLMALIAFALGGLALIKTAWVGVFFSIGLFGAPLLALATGWLELGLCLSVPALLSPFLAALFRLAVAQPQGQRHESSDARWAARPHQSVPRPQALPPAPPQQRPAGGWAQAAAPSQSRSAPQPSPAIPQAPQQALGAEDWAEIKRHLKETVGDLFPKINGARALVLFVLFVLFPPLALAAVLGALAYSAHRIATVDAARRERLLANPKLRAALSQLQRKNPELYERLRRFIERLR